MRSSAFDGVAEELARRAPALAAAIDDLDGAGLPAPAVRANEVIGGGVALGRTPAPAHDRRRQCTPLADGPEVAWTR